MSDMKHAVYMKLKHLPLQAMMERAKRKLNPQPETPVATEAPETEQGMDETSMEELMAMREEELLSKKGK